MIRTVSLYVGIVEKSSKTSSVQHVGANKHTARLSIRVHLAYTVCDVLLGLCQVMNIDTLSASNPMTIAFIAQLMAVYFLLESLQPVTRQWPFMSYQLCARTHTE